MQIKLLDKTYRTKFISTRMYLKAIQIRKNYDLNVLDDELFDVFTDFVAELFDYQFTIDEFLDGLPAEDLENTFVDALLYASGAKKNEEQVEKQKAVAKSKKTPKKS